MGLKKGLKKLKAKTHPKKSGRQKARVGLAQMAAEKVVVAQKAVEAAENPVDLASAKIRLLRAEKKFLAAEKKATPKKGKERTVGELSIDELGQFIDAHFSA